ncbi:MAG: hypothetical protein ACRDYC_04225, partial [Acidimicrobiales bacterium]
MVAAASLTLVAAGCGSPARTALPQVLPTAPEPANSPPTAVAPAGQLVNVGNQPEGIAIDPVTGIIAVAVRQPDAVVFLSASTGVKEKTIPLAGSARHLE